MLSRIIEWASPRCQLCQLPNATSRKPWCEFCESQLPNRPHCTRCGYPQSQMTDACPTCDHTPPPWQRLIRFREYEFPMNKLIIQFKQSGDLSLGKALSLALAHCIDAPADLMISVPSAWHKKWTRGFNQSSEMAYILAKHHNVRYSTKVFQKISTGKSQKMLSREERQHNAKQAFQIHPKWRGKLPKHVGLVDDIVTTGSTISILSELLQQENVEQIDVYCLAVTPLK